MDAGDIFQGRPVGTITNGKAVVEFMNAIGYDAMTIGNHEYDIHEEKLIETLQLAQFPVLSCNIIDKRTGEIQGYAQPYIMVERLGHKNRDFGFYYNRYRKNELSGKHQNIKFLSEKERLINM